MTRLTTKITIFLNSFMLAGICSNTMPIIAIEQKGDDGTMHYDVRSTCITLFSGDRYTLPRGLLEEFRIKLARCMHLNDQINGSPFFTLDLDEANVGQFLLDTKISNRFQLSVVIVTREKLVDELVMQITEKTGKLDRNSGLLKIRPHKDNNGTYHVSQKALNNEFLITLSPFACEYFRYLQTIFIQHFTDNNVNSIYTNAHIKGGSNNGYIACLMDDQKLESFIIKDIEFELNTASLPSMYARYEAKIKKIISNLNDCFKDGPLLAEVSELDILGTKYKFTYKYPRFFFESAEKDHSLMLTLIQVQKNLSMRIRICEELGASIITSMSQLRDVLGAKIRELDVGLQNTEFELTCEDKCCKLSIPGLHKFIVKLDKDMSIELKNTKTLQVNSTVVRVTKG